MKAVISCLEALSPVAAKTKLCTTVQMIAARKSLDRPVVPLTFALVRVCVLFGAFVLVFSQNRLWGLFARHTTMTLIILYLVYSQVSTVVSEKSKNKSLRMYSKGSSSNEVGFLVRFSLWYCYIPLQIFLGIYRSLLLLSVFPICEATILKAIWYTVI